MTAAQFRPLAPATHLRAAPKVEVLTHDPRLDVSELIPGTLRLVWRLPRTGPDEAHLGLKLQRDFVTFVLRRGMTRVEVLEAIRRGLPKGWEAASALPTDSEVLLVSLMQVCREVPQPVASAHSDDPGLSFERRTRASFTVRGRAEGSGPGATCVRLTVDELSLQLPLGAQESPLSICFRLREALPEGYSALLELPVYQDAGVRFTVMRRAEA